MLKEKVEWLLSTQDLILSEPLVVHTKYISNTTFTIYVARFNPLSLSAVQWMHAKETKVTNRILPGGGRGSFASPKTDHVSYCTCI